MNTTTRYQEDLLDHLRPLLAERVDELVRGGGDLPEVGDLAADMASLVPHAEPHPLASRLGPFYLSDGVMSILELNTKQALDSRRRSWSVLAMKSADHKWLYPSFQFDLSRHRVLPAFQEVLPHLRDIERWSAGLWLTDPHPSLDGATPLEVLTGEGDATRLTSLARAYRAAVLAP